MNDSTVEDTLAEMIKLVEERPQFPKVDVNNCSLEETVELVQNWDREYRSALAKYDAKKQELEEKLAALGYNVDEE